MKKRIALQSLAFSFLMLVAFSGCDGSPSDRAGETTMPVTLSLRLPEASKVSFKTVSAPSIVASLELVVTGEGMTTMTDHFSVSPGENVTRILDVPFGSARIFAVTVFDAGGNALFVGESEPVDIIRFVETPPVRISLQPLLPDIPSELPRFSENYLLLDVVGHSPFAGFSKSEGSIYESRVGIPSLFGEESTSLNYRLR